MITEEVIVQVDENDSLVGKIERSQAHIQRKLKLHREVMCLLFDNDNHERFLLQRRSMLKKQYPDLWTLSATGHVNVTDLTTADKEGFLTAAKREVKEEIGVELKRSEFLGKLVHKTADNFAMMGIVLGEYVGEIKINQEEVSEVRLFDRESIVGICDKLTPGAKACLVHIGILNK